MNENKWRNKRKPLQDKEKTVDTKKEWTEVKDQVIFLSVYIFNKQKNKLSSKLLLIKYRADAVIFQEVKVFSS